MTNIKGPKGKHLTMEDRIIIQYGLEQNYQLREVAMRIGKDPPPISKKSKEIRFLK